MVYDADSFKHLDQSENVTPRYPTKYLHLKPTGLVHFKVLHVHGAHLYTQHYITLHPSLIHRIFSWKSVASRRDPIHGRLSPPVPSFSPSASAWAPEVMIKGWINRCPWFISPGPWWCQCFMVWLLWVSPGSWFTTGGYGSPLVVNDGSPLVMSAYCPCQWLRSVVNLGARPGRQKFAGGLGRQGTRRSDVIPREKQLLCGCEWWFHSGGWWWFNDGYLWLIMMLING